MANEVFDDRHSCSKVPDGMVNGPERCLPKNSVVKEASWSEVKLDVKLAEHIKPYSPLRPPNDVQPVDFIEAQES
jgi:hypothetical protein